MKICIYGFEPNKSIEITKINPWNDFIFEVKNNGNEIVDVNSVDSETICVFNKYSVGIKKATKYLGLKSKNQILILWEPPSTNKYIYKAIEKNLFGKIFTPSKNWTTNAKSEYFRWPQINGKIKGLPSFESRQNQIVFIGRNKFSLHSNELYSLRREIVQQKMQAKIDIYGSDWRMGLSSKFILLTKALINTPMGIFKTRKIFNFLSYKLDSGKGVCEDKFHTLGQYKFSLVIENSNDYVSEKLFDSLAANCLTFYIGPNLKKMGYDPELAIELSEQIDNISEYLHNFLNDSDNLKFKAIIEKQQKAFLKENELNNNNLVFRQIAASINRYISEEFK